MVRTLALLVLLAAGPSWAWAQGLDQRVPAKPGGRLQVDLDLGEEVRPERVSLEVRSHDADEVWAVADLSGLGSTSVKFRVDHDDASVRLYGRADGVMSWLFGGPGVRVRIWVPREFGLDLRCTSGPIRVEDVHGSVRARTTDAAIEIQGVVGDVDARTHTGGIRVTEVNGDVDVRITTEGPVDLSWIEGRVRARTGEGDIQLRHVKGPVSLRAEAGEIGLRDQRGRTDAKTEAGAVFASFAGPPEGVIETRRGSVEIVVPERSGSALQAETGQGTVDVEASLRARGESGNGTQYVGAINGGGPPLRVYTARGTIRVTKR